jgi:hypothetical protein
MTIMQPNSWGRQISGSRPQSLGINNYTKSMSNSVLFSNEQTRNSSIDLNNKLRVKKPVTIGKEVNQVGKNVD